MHHFLLLGGDSRHIYLNRILANHGYASTLCYHQDMAFSLEEALPNHDILLCPIPFTKDQKNLFSVNALEQLNIRELLHKLTSDHCLFGGNIPAAVQEYTRQNKIPCFDYMQMEDIALANTVATAEGAVAEAIRLSPLCLHKNRCLVIGFGRCGKTLAMKLKGMDADVAIADQSSIALSQAAAFGFCTLALEALESHITDFPFIFNTVPAPVLHKKMLQLLQPDAAIIDIASAPGGTDFDCCRQLGIRAKLCLGLPGIYAPQACAEILYQGIMKYLS